MLNQVTTDSYPIPQVDDLLDTLEGAKWFSTLNLSSGYWQVEMDVTLKEYTEFNSFQDLYEFNVMPFGLRNATGTLRRLMELVLHELAWVYLPR